MSVLSPISLLVSLLYKKMNEIVKASREPAQQFNAMKADWCSEERHGGKEDLSFDKYNLWHLDGQQC